MIIIGLIKKTNNNDDNGDDYFQDIYTDDNDLRETSTPAYNADQHNPEVYFNHRRNTVQTVRPRRLYCNRPETSATDCTYQRTYCIE